MDHTATVDTPVYDVSVVFVTENRIVGRRALPLPLPWAAAEPQQPGNREARYPHQKQHPQHSHQAPRLAQLSLERCDPIVVFLDDLWCQQAETPPYNTNSQPATGLFVSSRNTVTTQRM